MCVCGVVQCRAVLLWCKGLYIYTRTHTLVIYKLCAYIPVQNTHTQYGRHGNHTVVENVRRLAMRWRRWCDVVRATADFELTIVRVLLFWFVVVVVWARKPSHTTNPESRASPLHSRGCCNQNRLHFAYAHAQQQQLYRIRRGRVCVRVSVRASESARARVC